jgi:hypothetical protein
MEKSLSELMTGHEVHGGAIWIVKYIAGKVLIMTFAYRSTCYFLRFHTTKHGLPELELEESVSELMTGHEVHNMSGSDWKMEGRKLKFKLWMTLAYHYLLYGFTPLNSVYAKLQLDESVSELMTALEVNGWGGLVWKIKGKVVKV